jgi:hypothetical protein
MSVGTNYSTPVTVNGFSCRNCTEVDYAKKHIDPAHPRSGPYGITAKDDPTVKQAPAIVFGGSLGRTDARIDLSLAAPQPSLSNPPPVGARLDVSA